MRHRLSAAVGALAVALLVFAIVATPVLAFDNTAASDNAAAPESSNAGGNSAEAPGHADDAVETAAADVPNENSNAGGNSAENSNAGGNGNGVGQEKKADEAAADNNGGSGNNVPADNLNDGVGGGVGNSENQDKDRPGDASNGPGTGQEPAPDCTNPHQGADDPQGGANNNPGPYDNTCNGRPSDNGQGGGNATGRPCMGCVGNADDKNPPGQFPNGASDGNRGKGKGNGRNRGYECDDNNGVGKGNPAHTGCVSTPPPCTENCVQFDCLNHALPNDHNHSAEECDPSDPPDCDNDGIPDAQDTDNSSCSNPPPDCDNDGIPDSQDTDNSGCEPIVEDCDEDGIPDDVDADISTCEPGEEQPPEGEDCDNDGIMDDVDPDISSCIPDSVLGIQINRPNLAFNPAVAPAAVAPAAVKGAALPFTGGNLLPTLILGLSLMATGGMVVLKKK